MENVSILAGKAAAGHGEMAGTAVRVSGHGLVDHDAVQKGGVAVTLGIVCRKVAVRQLNGVQAFDADALGKVRDQRRIGHMDLRSRVDRRGAQAIGGISTAVHVNRAAASVGADRCGGPATGGDVQIIGIGGAAACGHNAAGAVTGCNDLRIPNNDRSTVAGSSVLTAVATVAKNAVCAVCVRGDRSAGDGGRRTVLHKDSRIQAIEVAVVAAVGVAGFRHRRICDRDLIRSGDQQGALVSRGTGVGLTALRISGSNLNRRCVIDIRAASAGSSARRTAGTSVSIRLVRRGVPRTTFREFAGEIIGHVAFCVFRIVACSSGLRLLCCRGCIISISGCAASAGCKADDQQRREQKSDQIFQFLHKENLPYV